MITETPSFVCTCDFFTTHFAFTPLDDSTHLRCFCTPTVSFVLDHFTFLRIYVSTAHFAFTRLDDSTHTVRRLSVLFYTTVRFYASTILLYVDCQFCFISLNDSTHLRCYCTPTGSFFFIPLYVSTHLRFYGSLYIVTAY